MKLWDNADVDEAMPMWRVFIGDGCAIHPDEADWAHVDERLANYEDARSRLLSGLDAFQQDTCETCRFDAAHAARRLRSLQAGGEFFDDVDGETYTLIQVGRTDMDELTAAASAAYQAIKTERP